MKKLNLICASIAALFAAGAVNAGTAVSTPTKIAVENFGGSAAAQDALTILGAPISYSMSTITAVNAGSTVYFTVRLTGGKFAAVPAVTQFSFAGQACSAGAATTANPLCAVTRSADHSTVKVAVTTGASYTLGLGAFTFTPAATDIDSVNTTLGTVGGKVSASIGLVTLDPASIQSTAAQETIDAPLASGDLAVAARAITGAVSASSYTGKIDLTVTPAASNYTTAGYAILGQYKFTNADPGTAKILDGSADYTLARGSAGGASPNTGATVTVTPGAGQAFPIGSTVKLSSSATCANTLGGAASVSITSANAATAKTLTTTTVVADNTAYYVCVSAPSVGNTAAPIQATISATVSPAAANDSIQAASGTGYSLGYNGSTVDVQTYWPGALSTAGFTGYLRLTNTGSVSAVITGQHFNAAGALAGTPAPLDIAGKMPGGTLAAGQSVLLTTAEVDAVLGAAPTGLSAGRLRLTAPTDGLRVQSMLQSGNGVLVEFNNKVNSSFSCSVTAGDGSCSSSATQQ